MVRILHTICTVLSAENWKFWTHDSLNIWTFRLGRPGHRHFPSGTVWTYRLLVWHLRLGELNQNLNNLITAQDSVWIVCRPSLDTLNRSLFRRFSGVWLKPTQAEVPDGKSICQDQNECTKGCVQNYTVKAY